MIVREANPGDAERVLALRLRFLAEHRGTDVGAFPAALTAATRAFLDRHADAGTIRSWLVDDGGTDVGVVTMLLLDLAPRPEDASGREGNVLTGSP